MNFFSKDDPEAEYTSSSLFLVLALHQSFENISASSQSL